MIWLVVMRLVKGCIGESRKIARNHLYICGLWYHVGVVQPKCKSTVRSKERMYCESRKATARFWYKSVLYDLNVLDVLHKLMHL